MISLNGTKIEPTIFPDQTSQVWKLPGSFNEDNTIFWEFESEAELFHVCQLSDLIKSQGGRAILVMNYLPYGRQDKDISNEETFALNTFARVINSCEFSGVQFLDAHSKIATELINNSIDIFPGDNITKAIEAIGDNVRLAYPDAGAKERYGSVFGLEDAVVGHKVRNQQTGYIEKYSIHGNPVGKDILIVDDICDGGMTFRIMARDLRLVGANSVNLYVTHGIFSKGINVLREDGISRIFTHKGEV